MSQLEQESREELLRGMRVKLEWDSAYVKKKGFGGLFHLIGAEPEDSELVSGVELLRGHLGIDFTDVRHISIARVVQLIELGFSTPELGISPEYLHDQRIEENVFQFVYRGFGQGESWRIGRTYIDDIQNTIARGEWPKEWGEPRSGPSLKGTVYEEFLSTLDLDLGDGTYEYPCLIVLHYPKLDVEKKIMCASDAEPANLSLEHQGEISKYLRILGLISQVWPGRFREDNPGRHVVVNLLDCSYYWYALRGRFFHRAMSEDIFDDSIHTPDAEIRNNEIRLKIKE